MVLSLYGSKEEQRIDASIVLRISQKNELRAKFFVEKPEKKETMGAWNIEFGLLSEILSSFW